MEEERIPVDKLFNMVEIEVNSHCNRACWYCPNSIAKRKETGEMSEEVFDELMRQLKSVGFKGRISYHFYGEPLLCSKIEQFVETSKRYLPESLNIIYTNGDYLTLEKMDALFTAGVDRFIVTNHAGKASPFKQVYDQIPEHFKKKIVYNDYKELVLSNRGGVLEDKIPKSSEDLVPCYVPSSLVVVTLKGNVLPCFEDFHQTKNMGNIMEANIAEIWNSETYKLFREELKKGNRCSADICRKCNNFSVQSEEMYEYVL